MNEETRDLRKHDSRTRLAETCGAREESPSVKQGEAIRADVMKPGVYGSATQNECAHASPMSLGTQEHIFWRGGIEDAPKLTTLSESEQYMTTSRDHGVPWKRREHKIELNFWRSRLTYT